MLKENEKKHIEKYSSSLQAMGFENPKLAWRAKDETIFEFKNFRKLYLCPLCVTRALYEDRDFVELVKQHRLDNEFTKDHFPPKSVGGHQTILVCKICNSGYGATIDLSIEMYVLSKAMDERKSNVLYAAKITIDGLTGYYNMPVGWTKDKMLGCIIPSKQKRVRDFLKENKKNIDKQQINLKVTLTPPPLDNVFFRAAIKSAYLKCFSVWGYDFVFSWTGEMFRKIIANEADHPSKGSGVFFLNDELGLKDGLYTFKVGEQTRMYLVAFKIELGEHLKEKLVIIIPENTKVAWRYLRSLPKHKGNITIDTPLYEVPNHIEQREFFSYKGTGKKYNEFI